jgi:ABC-type lipoprotein release transport system permease subunit
MGKILLVGRLAARDLRRRPAQAALLLLVIAAAMGTLTLGLILHGVTSKPYGQTRAATAGPDVVASSVGFAGQSKEISASALGRFAALARAPGVTAHSGPYPVAWPVLRAHGMTAGAMAEGRAEAPAAVDQPKIVAGTWLHGGGVVLERAFADAMGVRVGDHVTLDGRRFRVTGIGVTAAVPVFSQVCFYGGCSGPAGQSLSFDTGLVWLTPAAARSLGSPGNPLTYYLNLRLRNPAAAPAFASAHQPPPGPGLPPLTAWQSLRHAAATLVAQEQQVLVPASWLLGLLAVATVAVVAGGRMAEQEKRVGLLKAAGGTPLLAAAVLLAEHLAVALAAAGGGLAAGWLAAPLLTRPGASLVGSPGAPSLTPSIAAVVVAAAVAVAAASTVVPAVRAARIATVAALAGAARAPRRRPWLIKVSSRLPVPLLLGLRLVARRPRRVLLSAASFGVTATTIVAVLIYHATASQDAQRPGPFAGAPDPGQGRVSEVLLVITVVMIILAAANAIFTTWATVLDARRFSAIARALGATPQQAVAGLTAAQLLPALVGAVAGIPAGTVLYTAVQDGGPQAGLPAWWLLAVVAGMLVAVAGLTAIPVRLGARRPAAQILQSESA